MGLLSVRHAYRCPGCGRAFRGNVMFSLGKSVEGDPTPLPKVVYVKKTCRCGVVVDGNNDRLLQVLCTGQVVPWAEAERLARGLTHDERLPPPLGVLAASRSGDPPGTIRFQCPQCRTTQRGPERMDGHPHNCLSCGRMFLVPAPGPESAPWG